MAIEKVYLDPNAVVYTDDEIVGKVNTATDKVSADACEDGTTNKVFTATEDTKLAGIEDGADANVGEEFSAAEQTKLTGIDAGAEVNPADLAELDATANTKLAGIEDSATADQTGTEMRDGIVELADDDREILISRPQTGQKKIYAVQTHSDGKQEIEQSDTAES